MITAPSAAGPGQSWLNILSGDEDAFRYAFTACPILDASVLRDRLAGVEALRGFFEATRSMYDTIVFISEVRCDSHVLLEWEGLFKDRPVVGVTVLAHNAQGVIEQVQVHHRPYDQVVAFATALAGKL